jgi:malate dehydrogenase
MAIIPPVGTYGLSTDLCFSLPVKCKGGFTYEIVEGLEMTEFAQKMFNETREELIQEKEMGGLI